MGQKQSTKPNITVWDIEVTWGLDAGTGAILCIAYKDLHEKNVHCVSQWDFKNWHKDIYNDSEVVKAVHPVLFNSDGHVFQFGIGFDLPYFNSRALKWGLPPIPKGQIMDTWVAAKKKMRLEKRSLDSIARFFDLPTKTHVGIKTWQGVMNRDVASCKKMANYCKNDVKVLEGVYLKLRPLMPSIPNYNLWKRGDDPPVCARCGSDKTRPCGFKPLVSGKYQKFLCKDCGSVSRSRYAETGPIKREKINEEACPHCEEHMLHADKWYVFEGEKYRDWKCYGCGKKVQRELGRNMLI